MTKQSGATSARSSSTTKELATSHGTASRCKPVGDLTGNLIDLSLNPSVKGMTGRGQFERIEARPQHPLHRQPEHPSVAEWGFRNKGVMYDLHHSERQMQCPALIQCTQEAVG